VYLHEPIFMSREKEDIEKRLLIYKRMSKESQVAISKRSFSPYYIIIIIYIYILITLNKFIIFYF